MINTVRLFKKGKIHVLKLLKQQQKSQYYSLKQLREIQNKKLRALIKYSYQNVPYYHELLRDQNLHYSDIKSTKDLKKIPVLTKKNIQQNLNNMISINFNKNTLLENHTGGSTGHPIIFYQDKNYLNNADAARILSWYTIPGYRLGSRTAVLWGAERDIRSKQSFVYTTRKWIYGTVTMNCNKMNDEKYEKFCRMIRIFKPVTIRGYAASLYHFANYIEKNQIQIPKIACIISTAETLLDYQRKKLESVFNCHILNSYGCREVSQIAMECKKHNGLHILMENQIVEVVDSNGEDISSGTGNVIVTNLNNYGMPFIRYNIEDIAQVSSVDKCECNRGLELIDKIIGRQSSIIKTPRGNYLQGEFFLMKFLNIPGINEIQVLQDKIDHIIIYIVEGLNLDKNIIEKIRCDIKEQINENMTIKIQYIDTIKKPKSGKFQHVISYIN